MSRTTTRREQFFIGVAILTMLTAYSQWRLTMNHEFAPTTWEQLISLDAERPFGLRVLVPLMARPFVALHLADAGQMFGILEFIFSAALFVTMWHLCATWLTRTQALLASYIFFLFLTIPFLLQHRWPLYYPYDTASLFFIAAGVYAVITQRWWWALLTVAIGTINRETMFLVPLCAVAYYATTKQRHSALRWVALMGVAYAAVRLTLYWWLRDLPGDALRVTLDGGWRIASNLNWLRAPAHWTLFLSYLGSLPLWWLAFFHHIPPALRNTRYVAAFFFIMLMWVGNVYEPRIYGELLVLLYVPVVVGLVGWLAGNRSMQTKMAGSESSFQHILDRPGVSLIFIIGVIGTLAFFYLNPLPG